MASSGPIQLFVNGVPTVAGLTLFTKLHNAVKFGSVENIQHYMQNSTSRSLLQSDLFKQFAWESSRFDVLEEISRCTHLEDDEDSLTSSQIKMLDNFVSIILPELFKSLVSRIYASSHDTIALDDLEPAPSYTPHQRHNDKRRDDRSDKHPDSYTKRQRR